MHFKHTTYEAFSSALLAAIRRPNLAQADAAADIHPGGTQPRQTRDDIDPGLIVQIERAAALDERKKALANDRVRLALAGAFARPAKAAAAKRGPESVARAIMGARGPRKPLTPAARAVLRAC